MSNVLYFGDNLEVLRVHIPSESVDLIYLDPPFKSNATYNVLFAEKNGSQAAAQIKAFEDTWHWDQIAAKSYQEVVEKGGNVSLVMQACRTFLGCNDMLAYLSMMAIRLLELHRVLRPTGSLYLHCDPTASHYLKLLLDAVFGVAHFRNEIVWKRTSAHSGAKRWGPVHDTIFFYTKSDNYTWNPISQTYDPVYLDRFYRFTDEQGRRYRIGDLTGAGKRKGDSGKPWRGIDPTSSGRHWAVPNKILVQLFGPEVLELTVQEKLDKLDEAGLVHWPAEGEMPALIRYLESDKGSAATDVITDIRPVGAHAKERLGYPTQKPEALLERIIRASSNEGDLVLDPFCGCGTTVVAAHRLKRRWIGIDITHLAISLMRVRLRDTFGPAVEKEYRVIGEPVAVRDAEVLAKQDPYQFQFWALGLVGARPTEPKKGADKGIDGRLYFHDEGPSGKTKQVIISVKSGKLQAAYVRDLVGVIQRENADMGILISLEEPTPAMRPEAAAAGFYKSPGGTQHPKVQLLTIREMLEDGRRIDMPPPSWAENRTFRRAPRNKPAANKNQLNIEFEEGEE